MFADTPLALAQRLIACPSVTPATGGVFDAMQAMLEPLGFEISRSIDGQAPDGPVENLLAVLAGEKPAFLVNPDVWPRPLKKG